MDVPQKVNEWLQKNPFIQQGDHVVAAVSGGADSVCLLLCLHKIMKTRQFSLSALHVHHGIRAEAGNDAEFVRKLGDSLAIPFRLVQEDVPRYASEQGLSLEEAGRQVRYRALRGEQRLWQDRIPGHRVWIAVAHHQDDQAETVLLNLCRGTGIRGLGGMPPEQEGILRPLLACRREEIEGWLRENQYPWCEDATNQEDTYTRNRIRHHLLPWMTEHINSRTVEHINSRTVENINSFASPARELDEYLEQEAAGWLKEHAPQSEVSPQCKLPAQELASLPKALGIRIVQRALERVSGIHHDFTARHMEAVWNLPGKEVGKYVTLSRGLVARRSYDSVEISYMSQQISQNVPVCTAEYSVFARKNGQKIPENRYTKWFDYDKIKFVPELRTRRTGDRISLRGVGRKSLKSYMVDVKIPADQRDLIPVLADGDQVMWIVGYRMSAAYQVTEQTRQILQVSVHFDA